MGRSLSQETTNSMHQQAQIEKTSIFFFIVIIFLVSLNSKLIGQSAANVCGLANIPAANHLRVVGEDAKSL